MFAPRFPALIRVFSVSGSRGRGATVVVGAPKVRGATGGPTRVLALAPTG